MRGPITDEYEAVDQISLARHLLHCFNLIDWRIHRCSKSWIFRWSCDVSNKPDTMHTKSMATDTDDTCESILSTLKSCLRLVHWSKTVYWSKIVFPGRCFYPHLSIVSYTQVGVLVAKTFFTNLCIKVTSLPRKDDMFSLSGGTFEERLERKVVQTSVSLTQNPPGKTG